MENKEVTLTYDEMLKKAREIHPQAKLTKSSELGNWVIVIPTDFKVSEKLSESYRGTPAWDLYESYESNYGSKLLRWQYKNGYRDEVLEQVADRWNTQVEATNLQNNILLELNKESGILITDWDKASKSDIEKYFENERLADFLSTEDIKDIYRKMTKKWSDSL